MISVNDFYINNLFTIAEHMIDLTTFAVSTIEFCAAFGVILICL